MNSNPVNLVTIHVVGSSDYTESDSSGRWNISTNRRGVQTLEFSRIGYVTYRTTLRIEQWLDRELNITLIPAESDVDVIVTDSRLIQAETIVESTEAMKLLPTTTGNLESVLPHIALGARSGTGGELSSQYNVRGGNYDENLVYVNDFQIFRPQLLRSSQQEGLSFPNIDLIRDLTFSSGGYEAKYGDKMASVLDVRYKRPTRTRGSLGMSLLGGSAHLEGSKSLGSDDFKRFRYLIGARYKTTRYLLGSLDVEGEYAPNFRDIQGYFTLDLTRDLQLGLIANFNESRYEFTPISRATALGLIDFALSLTTVFQGQESDVFKTGMMGASLTYLPERDKNPLFLKLVASGYRGLEKENFDILGFYRLSQVESDIGSDNVGEEVAVLGIGTQHEFSRNRLFNKISNIALKGGIEIQSEANSDNSNFIQWGVTYQHEYFDDRLNEWERLDSAGYSVPSSELQVNLFNVLKSENLISSNKIFGYVQNTLTSSNVSSDVFRLTFGSRISYWDLNNELNFSPRLQFQYKPNKPGGITYKLATGMYYQTPLYRELRRPNGTINRDLRSQRAFHMVAGLSRDINWKNISDKPFKFIMEAYYKSFSNLITYDIDNIRIRYSGENDANGSAFGLDMRLNGEFVPGAESWVNFSLLRIREQLNGVEHLRINAETGEISTVSSVPRPTDQFFNISIFFQDYLPRRENFKVNLTMSFGTGLPFGVPENNTEFRNVFRYKAYRRVDIGFAWQLWSEAWKNKASTNHLFRGLENAWLSLEVFNLMGIENVSSNTWIRTIFQQQFAVPNNLTTRRINLRFRIEF